MRRLSPSASSASYQQSWLLHVVFSRSKIEVVTERQQRDSSKEQPKRGEKKRWESVANASMYSAKLTEKYEQKKKEKQQTKEY